MARVRAEVVEWRRYQIIDGTTARRMWDAAATFGAEVAALGPRAAVDRQRSGSILIDEGIDVAAAAYAGRTPEYRVLADMLYPHILATAEFHR